MEHEGKGICVRKKPQSIGRIYKRRLNTLVSMILRLDTGSLRAFIQALGNGDVYEPA